ncbi:hypothetical protein K402DRAFT_238867 [Aulographum hederae CBS 113979]|uniref:Uncharacterized protein n=1 Tax=Aulographum hederae CBS 113979 TaxID=1176131 RepID=A0A6G1GKP5_9PEZI|nr:hypothetical protein K402DRAFT_238867 [Aulographum hederae CBS 113979]
MVLGPTWAFVHLPRFEERRWGTSRWSIFRGLSRVYIRSSLLFHFSFSPLRRPVFWTHGCCLSRSGIPTLLIREFYFQLITTSLFHASNADSFQIFSIKGMDWYWRI